MTAVVGPPENLSERVRAALALVPGGMFVDGGPRAAASGATFAVDDPATGETLTEVPNAAAPDVAAAAEAAAVAQESWRYSPPRQRSEVLRRAFEIIQERRDDLAALMSLEMGKPLAQAHGEIDYGAEFLRWFAEEATRIRGDLRLAPDGNSRIAVMRQAVGPCLLITPWNFPLAMATRKVAPALAAGCTSVLKPAAQTPLTSLAVTAILSEAGAPAGVVNVLTTTDPGGLVETVAADGRFRKLSFTGSTAVGRSLLGRAAEGVWRTSMELGGNAPFVVLSDADLDAAVEGAMLAKLRNMGEACTAANRFYVHESLADEFSAELARRFAELTVGHGLDPSTDVGPLIDDRAVEEVGRFVDDAVTKGAEVLAGGGPGDGAGCYFHPTVLASVPGDAQLLNDEIFGPVAPVVAVSDDEEALRLANDTEYGLAAYVYARDVTRGLRFCERLEVGMVGLNRGLVSNASAPFGGVKASGLGREGGFEGLDEFLEIKYVAIDRPEAAR